MIKNISNSEKLDVEFDAWKLQENADTALIRINLKSSESVEPHVNEKTVIFFVLNGSGDLTIRDKKSSLAAGDSIKVTKGAMRGWTVTSSTDLELLVIKYLN
ncbi:cupin domain-containing protein [Bacteroidota bacterium]